MNEYEQTLHVDLKIGTSWEYWRNDLWVFGQVGFVLDTLRVVVVDTIKTPKKPVRIGCLVDYKMLVEIEPSPDFLDLFELYGTSPRHISVVPFIYPEEAIERIAAFVKEPLFIIRESRIPTLRVLPWFFPLYRPVVIANSSAGPLDLSYLVVPSPFYPAPRRTEPYLANLCVPALDSPIASPSQSDRVWGISNPDTLLSLPYGQIHCVEINIPYSQGRRLEYWTPGIGLVAWVEFYDIYGPGAWILAKYWEKK